MENNRHVKDICFIILAWLFVLSIIYLFAIKINFFKSPTIVGHHQKSLNKTSNMLLIISLLFAGLLCFWVFFKAINVFEKI